MTTRWRVLVVDDDRDVLDLIRMKLTDEYDVLCIDQAIDVSHATELFEPDLIILDIMMPKISGYQVVEFLKRNPMTARIPICFLSAKASARDLKYGYKLGADLYLTKPFQPERLIKNVKLLFERTPPARRPKHFTIQQINDRFKGDGRQYQVATCEAEAAAQQSHPLTQQPTPPPEPEPVDEEQQKTQRRHWVD